MTRDVGDYPASDEAHALDRAEDAYLRHRIGEHPNGLPIWAWSSAEQAWLWREVQSDPVLMAESWMNAHEEDGHDYLPDDYLAAEGYYDEIED